MDRIHVTARVDYLVDALASRATQVHGQIDHGPLVDVVCHTDRSVIGSGDVHADAIEAWLHDTVLVLPGGDGAPPRLVVPTLGLNGACIGEALRRWLRTVSVSGPTSTAA